MKQWYHPTPKCTGSACSFYLNDSENSFFSSIIKQKTWDADRRRATFHKDNADERVIVKFSCKEICALIDCMERNVEYSGYHGSNQIIRFRFGPYAKKQKDSSGEWVEGPQVGFSLTVNKESKEDSTNKKNFAMGFDYAEAMELRLLLEYLVGRSFDLDRKLRAKRKKEYDNGPERGYGTKPHQEPVSVAPQGSDNEAEIW